MFIALFAVKNSLHCVKYTVSTRDIDHDIYDYQEGRGIMEVERPQLKIKMTGTCIFFKINEC
jgi:hypothetical protein